MKMLRSTFILLGFGLGFAAIAQTPVPQVKITVIEPTGTFVYQNAGRLRPDVSTAVGSGVGVFVGIQAAPEVGDHLLVAFTMRLPRSVFTATFVPGRYCVGLIREEFTKPTLSVDHVGARGCNLPSPGFVDVTSVEYGRRGNVFELRKFTATYEITCDIKVKGSVEVNYQVGEVVDLPFGPAKSEQFGCGDAGDGDPTPDTPPVTPPSPFQILLPSDFDTAPLLLTNSSSSTLEFKSAVDQSTFNSGIHLSVTTDALDEENFHASITPERIAAPGAGDAKVTITTGPLTFPRVYVVTLTATSDSGETFSRTFLVQVTCDPPFILGIDQPKNITAANGTQVTLEVKPSGTGPFFYQWYKGYPGMTRNPVLAANESKLIFTTRETATYWVRVSNACGTVNSNPVTVTTTGSLAGPARRRS